MWIKDVTLYEGDHTDNLDVWDGVSVNKRPDVILYSLCSMDLIYVCNTVDVWDCINVNQRDCKCGIYQCVSKKSVN